MLTKPDQPSSAEQHWWRRFTRENSLSLSFLPFPQQWGPHQRDSYWIEGREHKGVISWHVVFVIPVSLLCALARLLAHIFTFSEDLIALFWQVNCFVSITRAAVRTLSQQCRRSRLRVIRVHLHCGEHCFFPRRQLVTTTLRRCLSLLTIDTWWVHPHPRS